MYVHTIWQGTISLISNCIFTKRLTGAKETTRYAVVVVVVCVCMYYCVHTVHGLHRGYVGVLA